MRSRTLSSLPGRCPRCWLKSGYCLCAELPRVETRTHVVVVRHQREGEKSTNTARIAHLALPNSEILEFDGTPESVEGALAKLSGAWLLFPEGEAPPPASPPEHLVVVDGTWRQVRRMIRKLPSLQALPRLSLPAPRKNVTRLRRSPCAEGMSTLEAIAAALSRLEGEQGARTLEALHDLMVERVLAGRGLRRPSPAASVSPARPPA
ncbi:MAG: tRNA-uridine aminocarboxypropyltransferase [Myxococcaceae bacterium]